MLELKPLSYFVAAYEEGTLTAASSRCHIAQPSISHAIKTLETRIDTPLFKRHKKGLVPTQAAHQLYRSAKTLLEQSQRLENQLRSQAPTHLNIFVQADIQLARFDRLFKQWQHHIPYLTLNLVEQLDQADLAFIDHEQVHKNWESITLDEEHYVLVLPVHHALAMKPCIELQDLHQIPLVERPYCTRQQGFERMLANTGTQPTLTAKAQHDQQAFELIKLGFGLALVPETSFIPQQGLTSNPFTQALYKHHRAVAHRTVVLAYRRIQHIKTTFIEPLVI